MSVAANGHAHLQELIDAMTTVVLPADSPDIDRLVSIYREKFSLGPRDRSTERAQTWRGVSYEGKIVAVFGERVAGKLLEITDAYRDENATGLAAFASLSYGYYAMLKNGAVDQLVHTILWENEAHWRAIIRETGDPPTALVFVHRRKE
jgi:hypothetical protein